ncbi:hypothetical protein [Deinococcus malanensis]|nr:hypothetical protein [Deinococcus malanensis]
MPLRAQEAFDAASLREALAGRIVVSVGSHLQRDEDILAHLSDAERAAALDRFAQLHRHKIDLADEILVINVGGYTGETTRKEIAYVQQRFVPGPRLPYLGATARRRFFSKSAPA